MKSLTINASLREQVGKKDAKNLRKKGFVPCEFYGGKENIHLFVNEKDLSKLVYTPEVYTVKLNIAEKVYDTFMQDIQFHPVTDKILHIDFLQLFEDKQITLELPIKLAGNSIGVKNGGRLMQPLRKLKVKGLASVIPDNVEIDIEEIDIGDAIRVDDLKIEGLQFFNPPNTVVVTVKTARTIEVVEEESEEVAEGEEAKEGEEKPTDAKGGTDTSAEKSKEAATETKEGAKK